MPLSWNLHTHTWRCKHAEGDAIDYAREAAAAGMHTLGFADHTPWPDDRWPSVRMHVDQLDEYRAAVSAAQAAVPDLRVLLGMECEWLPEHADWLDSHLGPAAGFDYLIGAVHYFPPLPGSSTWDSPYGSKDGPADPLRYASQAVATIASRRFIFLAHPDVFAASNPEFTADCATAAHQIARAAADHDVPLELNSYGLRKAQSMGRPPYPWRPFWEIVADYPVRVVISSDAHRPHDVAHGEELVSWIDDLNLTPATLEQLVPSLAT